MGEECDCLPAALRQKWPRQGLEVLSVMVLKHALQVLSLGGFCWFVGNISGITQRGITQSLLRAQCSAGLSCALCAVAVK